MGSRLPVRREVRDRSLHPALAEREERRLGLIPAVPRGVMVAREILDLFVKVRVLARQPILHDSVSGFFDFAQAFFLEKTLQQLRTLVAQNTRRDIALVIERRILEQIQ